MEVKTTTGRVVEVNSTATVEIPSAGEKVLLMETPGKWGKLKTDVEHLNQKLGGLDGLLTRVAEIENLVQLFQGKAAGMDGLALRITAIETTVLHSTPAAPAAASAPAAPAPAAVAAAPSAEAKK